MQKTSESAQSNIVESQEKVIFVYYVEEKLVGKWSSFVILDIFQEKVVKLKKQLSEFVEERRG